MGCFVCLGCHFHYYAEEKRKLGDDQAKEEKKLDDDQTEEKNKLDENEKRLDEDMKKLEDDQAEEEVNLYKKQAEERWKLNDDYTADKRKLDDDEAEEEEKLKGRFAQKLEDMEAQGCVGNATVRDSATEEERARLYLTNPSSGYDFFKQRLGERYENRNMKLATRYESQKTELAQLKSQLLVRHSKLMRELKERHTQGKSQLQGRHAQERAGLKQERAALAKRHSQERAALVTRQAQERADLATDHAQTREILKKFCQDMKQEILAQKSSLSKHQDLKQQLADDWAELKQNLQEDQEKETEQRNMLCKAEAQLQDTREILEAEFRSKNDSFRRDISVADLAKARSIPCYTGYAWMNWLTAKWQSQPDLECKIQSCCTEFTEKLVRRVDNSVKSVFTASVTALFTQFLSQAVSPEVWCLCRSALRLSGRKYPVEPDIRICREGADGQEHTLAIFEMNLNLSGGMKATTTLQKCAGYYLECLQSTDKVKGSSGYPYMLGVTMGTKLCFMYLMLKGSSEVVCLRICELNLKKKKDVQVFFETLYTAIVDLEKLKREHGKLPVFNKPILRESWDPTKVKAISNRKLGARSNVVAYENRVYKLIRKRSSDSEELFENKRLNYAKVREKIPESMPGLREEQNMPFYPSNKYLLLSYDRLNGSHFPWCVEQIQRIGKILIEAHKNDLIHGDVRLANMIFAAAPNTDAILIDWDLAGTVKSTYPKGYNHYIEGDLKRHPGAVEYSHLSPIHDWYSFGDFLLSHFPHGKFAQNIVEARYKLTDLCLGKSELIEDDIEEYLAEFCSTPTCNPIPN